MRVKSQPDAPLPTMPQVDCATSASRSTALRSLATIAFSARQQIRSCFSSGAPALRRGFGDHAVELGAIVVDQADVLGNDIVDFPLIADQVRLVVDRVFFALAGEDFTADVGEGAIDVFVSVDDFCIGVGLDNVGVGAFEHFGEQARRILLVPGASAGASLRRGNAWPSR